MQAPPVLAFGFVEGLPTSSSPFVPEPPPLRQPRPEGAYFVCLFCSSGNWPVAHTRSGLRDLSETEPWLGALAWDALGCPGTFRVLCELARSGLVHDWHASPLSWTVSRLHALLGNRLVLTTAPGQSTLAPVGFVLLVRQRCSNVGELVVSASLFSGPCVLRLRAHPLLHWFTLQVPDRRSSQEALAAQGWRHSGECFCEDPSSHFPVVGRFTAASCIAFDAKCRPNASAVFKFGRLPCPGESVSAYCGLLPLPFASRAAAGSSLASAGI